MKEHITLRVFEAAHYIINNKGTVRETAKYLGVSKSTVHKDVSERLRELNGVLWKEARDVLNLNLDERHLRGGEATRNKYLEKTGRRLSGR